MIKHYFIQAIAELRQHPLISLVTIVGTALSIFLIMLSVMMEQIGVVPFAPESNRDRFLHVRHLTVENQEYNSTSNGPMSWQTAKELYKSLSTPEAVTAFTIITTSQPVALPGSPSTAFDVRETDAEFFHVFDFSFIAGKSYDAAAVDANQPVAVLSEQIARSIFGSTDVVGKEFLLSYRTYRVAGVVRDVSTLATSAYGQIWIPLTTNTLTVQTWNDGLSGMLSVVILAREAKEIPMIREEANRRLEAFNKQLEAADSPLRIKSMERPYTQVVQANTSQPYRTPDMTTVYASRALTIFLLLLIPAINLSSMTQSRLRWRVTEIGIRRAFGCTRSNVILQVVSENLIVSLLAGVVGLVMSLLFAFFFADTLFTAWGMSMELPAVNADILLQPSVFLYALLFCFVLNLMSSGYPAWRASRANIVNAINGSI